MDRPARFGSLIGEEANPMRRNGHEAALPEITQLQRKIVDASLTIAECAHCGKQTSLTAGTIMHNSKLPLTLWFWAAYLMATHSNGISALQLQRQLGLGSYKSAWLLCAKLRCSMVAGNRSPLAGLVEVDETEIVCRSKHDPLTGGGGRSHQGKILVVGAVEVADRGAGPGRIRLQQCRNPRQFRYSGLNR